MTTTVIDGSVVVVDCDTQIIFDGQSALDFAVNIGYEYNCRNIAVNKAAFADGFFDLSSGIAGEVVQKFVNYGFRLAIIGDFSMYTSKSLRDYIYECNRGKHLFFVADKCEAIKKLGGLPHEG